MAAPRIRLSPAPFPALATPRPAAVGSSAGSTVAAAIHNAVSDLPDGSDNRALVITLGTGDGAG
jgi:hypothetical protein